MQKKIKQNSLQDFKDWVSEWAEVMSNANKVGNTRRVYEGVKALRGKSERPPCNLSTNSQGVPLADAAAVAETWEEFLTNKFTATETEASRPPMSTLPIANTRH